MDLSTYNLDGGDKLNRNVNRFLCFSENDIDYFINVLDVFSKSNKLAWGNEMLYSYRLEDFTEHVKKMLGHETCSFMSISIRYIHEKYRLNLRTIKKGDTKKKELTTSAFHFNHNIRLIRLKEIINT